MIFLLIHQHYGLFQLSTFTSTGDEEKKKLLAQIETLKNEVADAVALRHVR